MSYGLKVLNAGGATIIDSVLPNMRLTYSGSAAAAGGSDWAFYANRGIINFPSAVVNPIVMARAAVGQSFTIHVVNTTSFEYGSTGAIDWKVYTTGGTTTTTNSHGIRVFRSDGGIVFDSNAPTPAIITTGYIPAGSGRRSYNFPFSGASIDGGLPFIGANVFGPDCIVPMRVGGLVMTWCAKFNSTTSLNIFHDNMGALYAGYPISLESMMQVPRPYYLAK